MHNIENSILTRNNAMKIIIFFGLISLCGDIIYEGARSVNGPYLKLLSANAALVGLIAGLSEFFGYFIRMATGYFADKKNMHWTFTIIGYGLLVSVPLMAFAGIWQIAALFIVAERLGKAVRSPAKDTIVSLSAKKIGTGFGFGILEALDQLGALAGPLIFTGLFFFLKDGEKTISDYQKGYSFFWIFFVLLMIFVFTAYSKFSKKADFYEEKKIDTSEELPKIFWLYTLFIFITTMGFVNFILYAYHFKKTGALNDYQIPLFYSIAMIIDGAAAVVIGKIYDILKAKLKNEFAGILTLIILPIFSMIIPFFGFSNNFLFIMISVCVWGIVMAGHETIMKSAIADMTTLKKRGTGYGIFNAVYGISMLIGATGAGYLYEKNLKFVIIASVLCELLSLIVLYKIYREVKIKK